MLAKHLLDCFRMRESPVFSMFGFAANPSANVKVGVMDERSEVSQMSGTILEPSLPSEAEVNLAKDARRVLAARMKQDGSLQLCILNDPFREEALNLPASAVRILERTLEEMARGNAVMLIPVHAELTTHEAANMLNISSRSLIQLLDEGKIEFRRVGSDRPVRLEALMEYKRQGDAERRKILEHLAASHQELGI